MFQPATFIRPIPKAAQRAAGNEVEGLYFYFVKMHKTVGPALAAGPLRGGRISRGRPADQRQPYITPLFAK